MVSCNIDKTDRINRVVIGVFLLLGAILGASTLFLLIAGVVLIAEGLLGWCGIPLVLSKLRQLKK